MASKTDTTHSALEQIDQAWTRSTRRKLKRWFLEHGRKLPWRTSKDPYRIWVSEIMLQQTQVATVVPYYDAFIKAYPNVKELAKADQQQVLRSWEGLGYYRRARQLHAAARKIVEDHGGKFPESFEDVHSLPGIGRYTAGAILSFAKDQRLPIVEANTIRLYSRLFALRDSIETGSSQAALWGFAESILPRKNPGDFNQALIDLGSLICVPRQPKCMLCPLKEQCCSRIAGLQHTIPVKKAKPKTKPIFESVVVIRRSGKVLMRICGEDEWWTGLWDFPRYRIEPESTADLSRRVTEQSGLHVTLDRPATTIRHAVTHHNISLDCYIAREISGRLKRPGKAQAASEVKRMQWIKLSEIDSYPLSVTARKVVRRLLEN